MGKGRAPCCDKTNVKKGPWTPAEDLRLIAFIQKNGHENWRSLPKLAGLARCGKSCRLRWINYLRPDVKRGNFTLEEEETIIRLHESMGNKWSRIASYFPGRTDNEIKNIWNTHLKKREEKSRKGDEVSSKDVSDTTSSSSSLSSSCDKSGKGKWKKDRALVEGHKKPHCEQNKRIITVPLEDTSTNLKDNNINESNVVVTIPKSRESAVYNMANKTSSEDEVNKPLGDSYDCLLHDIPNLEFDFEFWSMLDRDNLGSYFQTGNDIVVQDKVVDDDHYNSSFVGDYSKEAEQKKWLKHLETELGLLEAPKEQDDSSMIKPAKDDIVGILAYSEIWPVN